MSDQIDALWASWKINKENLPLTAELINALFSSEDWQRSEIIYAKLPIEVRHRSEVFARHIEYLLNHKQFTTAASEAQQLCNVTNNHPLSLHYLALTHFLAGRSQPVITLATNPTLMPETKVIVARTLYYQGKSLVQAINLLTGTVSAEGLGLLALLHLDNGQFEQAFNCSEQALKLKANQVDALQTKACLLLNERKIDWANQVIDQVLELKPNDPRTLAIKGQILFFSVKIPAAIKTLERTLTLLPDHVTCLNILAWCYCVSGQFDVAEMTFQKSLAITTDFAESIGGMAVIAALRGENEEVAELAAKALSMDNHCAAANYALELIAEQSPDYVAPNVESAPVATKVPSYGESIIVVIKRLKR